MKKRVLSLLMALTLCLTTLPTAVFADVTENGEGSGGTHYVAESGGTQYETVQEILDNMEEGEITLLDSVTEDLTVYAATTIHMNGHSITGNIDATDSLTLNGGTVDGTVKVDGGTLNMTAPAEAEAAITGGLNVVSGSASVSGAKVGVKGTLYFDGDGTDMLISGAVKAVELDSAAKPAAKTLYGSATVNGDTAAEAGFDTDTYKVGGEIAKKLTSTIPKATPTSRLCFTRLRASRSSPAPMRWAVWTQKPTVRARHRPLSSHVLEATSPIAALASRPRWPTMDESMYCIAMDDSCARMAGILSCNAIVVCCRSVSSSPFRSAASRSFFTYPLLSVIVLPLYLLWAKRSTAKYAAVR